MDFFWGGRGGRGPCSRLLLSTIARCLAYYPRGTQNRNLHGGFAQKPLLNKLEVEEIIRSESTQSPVVSRC